MNRALLCTAAVVAALALGACGGTDDGTGSVPGLPGANGSTAASSVDACALFTEEELTDVLGPHEKEQWSGLGESSCQWANTEHASVTIDIDREGTAPGGEVPPQEEMGEAEEGAEGVTYYAGGYTTFAVGERVCRLQIVVNVSDQMADRPAIDRFVGLVRERL